MGQYNDTKPQYVCETRTGTHQARRFNTPLNCITLSSCTTKHPSHGTYRRACGRSETDQGGGERQRRRRGVGRRQEDGRGRRSRVDSTTCGKASETPPLRSRWLLWGERTVFRPSQTHREGTLSAVRPASFDSVCSCALSFATHTWCVPWSTAIASLSALHSNAASSNCVHVS